MRKTILIIAFFVPFVAFAQQMKWNERYQQYIDQYKDIAIEQMLRWKIPASITLAQGIFESGAGSSELTRKGNNHFGIKCHEWKGRTVYHDDDQRNECFRAYDSPYQSFEDHSRFLSNGKRYQSLFSLKLTDYRGWARGLKAAGYATNPRYADQLIELIQLYQLYKYDTARVTTSISFHMRKTMQPKVNSCIPSRFTTRTITFMRVVATHSAALERK